MKKMITISAAALLILLAGTFASSAGYRRGPGSCPNLNYSGAALSCSGVTETITGTVESYGMRGGGVVVQTGNYTETLYGMGPIWYWERNGIDRPEIGETVTLQAETVSIGPTTGKVIVSITINGQTLVLRDSATCLPLWRGQRR